MSTDRIKQVLMGIGLLTVLGMVAMASLIAYLWWDAGKQTEDVDTDFDTESDFDTETDFDTESPSDDVDADAEVTGE